MTEYRALNALFAIRGVLTFVAFTEIITATRCLLPVSLPDDRERGGATYVQAKVFNQLNLNDVIAERAFCHVFGLYTLLNGLIVLHLAIFIHYKPLVSLTVSALSVKLLFFITQSLWFGTISGAPNLVFPIITCIVCIGAAVAAPFITRRPHLD